MPADPPIEELPVIGVPRPQGHPHDTALGEGLDSAPDVQPLLVIVIDRLRSAQAGPKASGQQAIALSSCEEALRQLRK